MLRQISLDTETTGRSAAENRIIEIGAIEIIDREPTGNKFHVYINPEQKIEAGAQAVHGITAEFLADKPKFEEIVDDFIKFVTGAELIIHNAPFDIGFLNASLQRCKHSTSEMSKCCTVLDTLPLARKMHPGQRNSLDALCSRYEVNNSKRQLHGALLDASLLLDVYLRMTGGQNNLFGQSSLASNDYADSEEKIKRIKRGNKVLPRVNLTNFMSE